MPMANPSVKDPIPSLKLTTAISPKDNLILYIYNNLNVFL